MSACADRELLLHGLIDGELDAASILACEAHLRTCAGCAAELERLQGLRSVLASPGVSFKASAAQRARMLAALDTLCAPGDVRASRRRRGAPVLWLGGALTALAAAFSLAIFLWLPSQELQDELIGSHVRSLLANHLVDVAASDRHVVKPWFNGKLDFAPPVVDLADQGFPLSGGRLDYLRGRVVAALVYRRRQHVINLFIWPATGALTGPAGLRQSGYSLERWSDGGLNFWAVSDTDARELAAFRAAFEARARG